MNIFILDRDPYLAANLLCNKHLCKMILETTQLISNSLSLRGLPNPYKTTHLKHPCTIWTAKNWENTTWLINYGIALCDRYTKKYSKLHKCQKIIKNIMNNQKESLSSKKIETFALAMPDQYKSDCQVKSYWNYYMNAKRRLLSDVEIERYMNLEVNKVTESGNGY